MSFIPLPSNRPPERFYRGGSRITDFRGEPAALDHEPEDWIGSVTTVNGEPEQGLTTLPDGRLLRSAVESDPEHWLGAEHVDRFGADTKLLVKLLDAGQRLPVHAHPSTAWASEHLGLAHGKAEAWYILQGGDVHLGLKRDLPLDEVAALVESQDNAALLAELNHLTVEAGDVVFVPPGVLHAIGEGVFLLEVQEPEDLSILLEWGDFDLDGVNDGHLGLGFDVALTGVEITERTGAALDGLVRSTGYGESVLPAEADEFFRIERREIAGDAELARGFAIVVVAAGEVTLDGLADPLPSGTTFLAPYSAGELRFRGSGEVLLCRPPRT
ncbi:class I mannose-6-phosphate isomerase [Amnibacterium flavum]|uniref:Carbohydrate kinase n=1 Tax=Amnibacterium flavum TaxID=2173173 RepID=A0A2V1HXG1_9MICO|nr:class I mannose-6-phosphate isomerase [Amnibacterium flavum]PVZ96009.1 carbohydrate kinase [Amnibacterium flavum]